MLAIYAVRNNRIMGGKMHKTVVERVDERVDERRGFNRVVELNNVNEYPQNCEVKQPFQCTDGQCHEQQCPDRVFNVSPFKATAEPKATDLCALFE